MQLTAYPITESDLSQGSFAYNEEPPQDFIWYHLDSIGDLLQPRTTNAHVAPELLDPFIFAQFCSGMLGSYTINGSPFYSNWRMIEPARRMAIRLGADALAEALLSTEKDLENWTPSILDAYDNGTLGSEKVRIELFKLLDAKFYETSGDGQCTYGQSRHKFMGCERLLAALADWIRDEMPKIVLANGRACNKAFEDCHLWAQDHVDNFYHEWVCGEIGIKALELLEMVGLKFGRSFHLRPDPTKTPVITQKIETRDAQILATLQFRDAQLLADLSTMTELARVNVISTRPERDGFTKMWHASAAPRFSIDADTMEVRKLSAFQFTRTPFKFSSDI